MCEEKYINEARDYAKANPEKTILDYLEGSDYYHNLSKYDKKHFYKKIMPFFGCTNSIEDIELFELIDKEFK